MSNLVSIRARDVVRGRRVLMAPGQLAEVLLTEPSTRPGHTLLHLVGDTLDVPSDGLVPVAES